MRRSWIVPSLVTSAALLTGCGSFSSSVQAAAPTTAVDQGKAVEDAVRSYSSAFLSGNGEKAASLLSQRCNTPALRQQIISAASMAPAMYGQAAIVSVSPIVNGDHATVTYRFNQPAIDQENQPWFNEGGAWHYDKCSPARDIGIGKLGAYRLIPISKRGRVPVAVVGGLTQLG